MDMRRDRAGGDVHQYNIDCSKRDGRGNYSQCVCSGDSCAECDEPGERRRRQ